MTSPIILSIDGNIGSGKSTLYNNLQTYYSNNDTICFVPEPVDEWKNIVDSNNVPILINLYKDTRKYAFRFQMMAYISRLHLLKQKVKENKYKIIISERSVETDKNVFAKMLYDDGLIEHDEFQIYNNWFDEFIDDIKLTGIIYVKAEPTVCNDRVKIRAREGEDSIPIDYLKKCHQYHEDWLSTIENKLIIEANEHVGNEDTDNIRQQWIKMVDEWIVESNCKLYCTQNNQSKAKYVIHETVFDKESMHVLQFDGACRCNPANEMGLGAVITYKDKTAYEKSRKLVAKNGTNNVAEYKALILGMKLALDNNITCLHVEGDSNLVINQMTGKFAVKSENLIELYNTAKELEKQFTAIGFQYIKRELNKKADRLANAALDRDTSKCSGCHPVFQENQLAHIGENGCIEED